MPPRTAVNDVVGDGEMLRALRENLRVTATEAAFHCDIDSGKLSKFENSLGRISSAQRERLVRYLHAEAVRRHRALGKLVASLPSQADRASVTA